MVGGMQREGARYKIGPLTHYAEPQVLQQWHLAAVAGEEMVYAIGPALGRDAATPKVARALEARGEAQLFLRRESGGVHYIIRKRERRDSAERVPGAADAWAGKAEGRVLAAVTELAEMGLPMPIYDELAEACGLADGEAVRYRLGVLAKAGAIRLFGVTGERMVEIVASGQRTARRSAAR